MIRPSRLLCAFFLGAFALLSSFSVSNAQDYTSDLVERWRLDDTSGSTINSLNGNDGSWTDGSGNDVAEEALVAINGGGINFDGTNDEINAGSSTVMWDSTGPMSASFWSYAATIPGVGMSALVLMSDQTGPFYVFYGGAGSYSGVNIGSNTVFPRIKTTGDISSSLENSWNHVVVTFDGVDRTDSSSYKIFVNGVDYALVASGSYTSVTNQTLIGNSGAGHYFDGIIDDVRVYRRALTSADVTALYNSYYANPDFTTRMVGHWKLDRKSGVVAPDSSRNNNDGTLYNDPDWLPSGGILKGALRIDGGLEYVEIPDDDSLDITGAVTAAAWVRWHPAGDNGGIICKQNATNSNNANYCLYISNADTYSFSVGDGSGSQYVESAVTPDNEWHHFAGVADGSYVTLYLDGVQIYQEAQTRALTASTVDLYLGTWRAGFADSTTNADIDDARLYDRALSPIDIWGLAQYTGPVAGTLRYNDKLESLEYYDSREWIHAGLGSYSPNAVSFDGVDDYLQAGSISSDSIGTKVTGSLWARRPKSENGNLQIVLQAFQSPYLIQWEASNLFFTKCKNADLDDVLGIRSTASYDDGEWHHFMWSADLEVPGSARMYVDDVDVTNNNIFGDINAGNGIDDTCFFGASPVYFGRDVLDTTYFKGDFADFWLDFGTYIDLSVEENRRKFISETGMPMALGANGSLANGNVPDVFLSGDTFSWHENKGASGGFTENSKIVDAVLDPGRSPVDVSIPSGLLGHWRLDETSGMTASDSSGNGNHGTYSNNVSTKSVVGRVATAVQFDGTSDEVVIPGSVVSGVTDEMTWSAWIKQEDLHTDYAVIMQQQSTTPNYYENFSISIENDDFDSLNIDVFTDNDGFVQFTSGISMSDYLHEWVHVAGVYDGSHIIAYFNGKEIAREVATGDVSINGRDVTIGVGENGGTLGEWFTGRIDDVKIWDRALSASEIRSLVQGVCSDPSGRTGEVIYNSAEKVMQYCNGTDWVGMGDINNGPGEGCINPTGTPGQMIYSGDYDLLQYCNLDDWIGVGKNVNSLLSAGLEGHWKLDERTGSTIFDSSGNGNDGTWADADNDDVTEESIAGQIDYSIVFDAVDDEIVVPNDETLENFEELTLSAWVYATDLGHSGISRIISKSDGGTADDYMLGLSSTNRANFRLNTSGGQVNFVSPNPIQSDTWQHVVGTWDGSVMRLYVDGIEQESVAEYGTIVASGEALAIGTHADTPTNRRFPGRIDDARVYSRALSAEEVVLLYGETNPIDLSTGLEGHWTMDDTSGALLTDSSGRGRDAVWEDSDDDDVVGETQNGILNRSILFDGTDDTATIPAFDLLGSGMTVSAWVYGDYSTPFDPRIISKTDGTNTVDHDWAFFIDDANGISLRLRTSGATAELPSFYTPPNGVWTHIAVSYSADTGNALFYVNGVYYYTQSHPDGGSVVFGNTGKDVGLGNNPSSVGLRPFLGLIDDLRLYSRPLGPLEMVELYEQGVGGILEGLVGHWPMDETSGSTIQDFSGHGNDGAWNDASGNDVVEETGPAPMVRGLTFDGSDDVITVSATPELENIFVGGGTYAAWIYPESHGEGNYGRIFAKNSSFNYNNQWHIDGNRGEAMAFSVNCTSGYFWWRTNTGTVPLNRWSHVAVVHDSSSIANTPTFYVNGSPVGYTTAGSCTGTVDDDASDILYIGNASPGSRDFDGLIDDARIYDRALSPGDIQALYQLGAFVPSDNLSGHWRLDETSGSTIVDSSGNGNDGTWSDGDDDDVVGETTSAIVGTGLDFDGADDVINIPDSSLWTINNGDEITYSAWVNFSVLPGASDYDSVITSNGNEYGLQLNGGPGSTVELNWWDGTTDHVSPSQVFLTDVWYHVALTVRLGETNGSSWWVNGTNIGSFTAPDFTADPSGIEISSNAVGSTLFTGQLDDVRIYDYALSASDVEQLYDIGLDTIPTSGLLSHWTLDETSGSAITDSAGSNDGTWEDGDDDDVTDESVPGRYGTAIDFDGNSDIIETGAWDITGGDGGLTIAAWINPDFTANDPRIISKTSGGTGSNHDWAFLIETTGEYLRARITTINGYQEVNTDGDYVVPANTWTHVVMTYDPANTAEEVRIFANGEVVTVGDHSFGGAVITGSGEDVAIGGNPASASADRYFDGTLDDVRVYNRGLSVPEVRALYNATR